MLPLNNCILLKSINTTQLVQDAIGMGKISKIKLSTIVTSNGFNCGIELSFNHVGKVRKLKLSI